MVSLGYRPNRFLTFIGRNLFMGTYHNIFMIQLEKTSLEINLFVAAILSLVCIAISCTVFLIV